MWFKKREDPDISCKKQDPIQLQYAYGPEYKDKFGLIAKKVREVPFFELT